MGVIVGNVSNISNTNIFVGKVSSNEQFVVYSNEMVMKEESMIILPVPSKVNRLYDMSEYKDTFTNIDSFFPKLKSYKEIPATFGHYDINIVNSYEDLETYKLNDDVLNILKKDYPNFSFILCKTNDSRRFIPFAYTHDIPSNGKLFIPTKREPWVEWNHNIYIMGTLEKQIYGMTVYEYFKIPRYQFSQYDRTFLKNKKTSMFPKLPFPVLGKKEDIIKVNIGTRFDQNCNLIAVT